MTTCFTNKQHLWWQTTYCLAAQKTDEKMTRTRSKRSREPAIPFPRVSQNFEEISMNLPHSFFQKCARWFFIQLMRKPALLISDRRVGDDRHKDDETDNAMVCCYLFHFRVSRKKEGIGYI